MYEFDTEVKLEGCSVRWMADSAGVRLPKSIKIEYWDGTEWKEVNATHEYITFRAGKYDEYLFESVTTSKIRLTMENNEINGTKYALAIYEWKLMGEEVQTEEIIPEDTNTENMNTGNAAEDVNAKDDGSTVNPILVGVGVMVAAVLLVAVAVLGGKFLRNK